MGERQLCIRFTGEFKICWTRYSRFRSSGEVVADSACGGAARRRQARASGLVVLSRLCKLLARSIR